MRRLLFLLVLASLSCTLPTLAQVKPLATNELPTLLPTVAPTQLPTLTPGPTCLVVSANTLHLRSKPTEHSPALDWLSVGNQLELIDSVGNWYHVDTGDQTGFVNARYVTTCP